MPKENVMRINKGTYFIIFGTVLLLAAVSLVVYNLIEDKKSGDYALTTLAQIKQIIEQTENESDTQSAAVQGDDLFAQYDTEDDGQIAELDTIEFNGDSYIGYITLSSLNKEFPVMADWSYAGLEKAPCRYSGMPQNNDFIIAGHNYRSHFGPISSLKSGDMIVFTDVNGNAFEYSVTLTETINGNDVDAMQDDSNEDWDLTLFTCTLSGQSRVTVRAVRVEK